MTELRGVSQGYLNSSSVFDTPKPTIALLKYATYAEYYKDSVIKMRNIQVMPNEVAPVLRVFLRDSKQGSSEL